MCGKEIKRGFDLDLLFKVLNREFMISVGNGIVSGKVLHCPVYIKNKFLATQDF